MGLDEERTVRVFRGHREIFESLVRQHRGRIFNTAGDALLAEYSSAVEAVRCATDIQAALRTRNEHLAPEERMLFRIGINLGDVIVQGGDLLGDGVNVAARIQSATEPGGICISGSVHEQIQNKLSLEFKLLGEQTYKNIARPVRTYTINEGAAVTSPARRPTPKLPVAIAAALLLIGGAGYWGYLKFDAQRAEQARVESQLATQLAAQKQATEQAQRAAEDAKRDAQLQAQRQSADETLRRAQEERSRLEQDRKSLDAERRTADAVRKQTADEALRRAQDERDRVEADRKQLEADKRAAEAARKPAAGQRTESAAPGGQSGTYVGRLCNQYEDKAPSCWSVTIMLRGAIAEGSWPGPTGQTTTATGTVNPDGTLRMKLDGLSREGKPAVGTLEGRIAEDAISASGQWLNGPPMKGSWKRVQTIAAATAAPGASRGAAPNDGTYRGKLCNLSRDKGPNCWSADLVLVNGVAEAHWMSSTQNTSKAIGTVNATGVLALNLSGWSREGNPVEGAMTGRLTEDSIAASGKWNNGGQVTGDWKRSR